MSNRRRLVLGACAVSLLLAVVVVAAVTGAGREDAEADPEPDLNLGTQAPLGECARITYDGRTYYSVGRQVARDDLVTPSDPQNDGEGPRSCDPGAMETLEFRPAGVRHIPGVDPSRAVVARYDPSEDRDALYVADPDYRRTGALPDDLAEALGAP